MAAEPSRDDEPRDYATFMKECRANQGRERLRKVGECRTPHRQAGHSKRARRTSEFGKWLDAQGGSITVGEAPFQASMRQRRAQ